MVARFGGEHGNPMASNPTSLYYNPAGLAGVVGTELYLEGNFAYRNLTYDRPTSAIDAVANKDAAYDTANSGEGTLTNVLASPFLGAASNLGVKGLGVGVGVFAPFGGEATFDKRDELENSPYAGALDGPQRWQDIEGTIRSIYASAGAGYQFNFGLRVGLALNLVFSEINDIKAFNANGTDNQRTEGRAWAQASNVTFAAGVGLQYSPPSLPGLAIGLSYQSQPGFGKMTESGDAQLKIGAAPTITPNIEVEQALPDIIRFGIGYRASEKLELRLFGAYERWSVFESQCFINSDMEGAECVIDDRGQSSDAALSNVPRNWKDVIGLRASGSYWISPSFELMLGLGYDGNAVPDETLLVDLPDFDNFEATLAAQFRVGGKLKIYVGFSQFIYLSRTIDPQPRNASGERTIYSPPTRQPDNAGEYNERVSLLTLGLGYTF